MINFFPQEINSPDPPCQYCDRPTPFSEAIPGLDGVLCGCGNWIGTCRQCRSLVGRLLEIAGICLDCDLKNKIALEEKRRKKGRKRGKTAAKTSGKQQEVAV